MYSVFWPCALLALGAMAWTVRNKSKSPYVAFAEMDLEEDADIKIASGSFSGTGKPSADVSELAAQEFLEQKKSGNIDRARDLGCRYAGAILDAENSPLANELHQKSQQMQHHQYLLYTYVVNRVIADFSPNSILAQTSLNVFYSAIEESSPDLHQHINDMAAFSLYILCARSMNRTDDEIGLIFAQLCGHEHDSAVIDYGNRLYRKLYAYCKTEIEKTAYKNL